MAHFPFMRMHKFFDASVAALNRQWCDDRHWHIASFRCDAEFGRYQSPRPPELIRPLPLIANTSQTGRSP
jgi:hypothetical protein